MSVIDFQAVLDESDQILAGQKRIGLAEELKWRIEDIIAGRRRSVRIKHHDAVRLSQALLPGTVTLLCGSPGASKSLWLQEVLMDLHERGERVALLHLEEDRTYHLRRAVAQMAGCADYTDEEWVKANPEAARRITEECYGRASSFAATITDCPEARKSYEDILAWCAEACRAQARVLAVDPITLAKKTSSRVWDADEEFITAAGRIIGPAGASLVLVTHPRKSSGPAKGGNFMDDMAGGAGLARAAQTILWLDRVDDPERVAGGKIMTSGMVRPADGDEVNRILRLVKTRNGKGVGASLAYHFDKRTLRHHELGLFTEPKKRGKR